MLFGVVLRVVTCAITSHLGPERGSQKPVFHPVTSETKKLPATPTRGYFFRQLKEYPDQCLQTRTVRQLSKACNSLSRFFIHSKNKKRNKRKSRTNLKSFSRWLSFGHVKPSVFFLESSKPTASCLIQTCLTAGVCPPGPPAGRPLLHFGFPEADCNHQYQVLSLLLSNDFH